MRLFIEFIPVFLFWLILLFVLLIRGQLYLVFNLMELFVYGSMIIWLLSELIRRIYRKFYPTQTKDPKYERGRERRFWKYKRIIVPRLFLGIFGAIIGMAWLLWSL